MTGRVKRQSGMFRSSARPLALAALVAFLFPAVPHAQEMGETILKQGKIDQNLLLAGRTITLDGDITGDVTAIGQDISVHRRIDGDVNVTAASVESDGHILGDLRAFAGAVTVVGTVDGDVNSAAGLTRINKTATVGGNASLAGHEVFVEGHIKGNLKVSARRVVIRGTVDGDVSSECESIRVGPDAVIKGKFVYRSEEDAQIDPSAKIGDLTFMHSDEMTHSMKRVFAFAGGAGVVFFVGILLLAALIIFIAPEISLSAARAIRTQTWRSGGIGLAVLVAMPIAVSLLFGTIVGFPIAIAAIMVYAILLAAGYLIAALAVGRVAVGLFGKSWDATVGGRIAAAEIGLIVLMIVALIPVLGVVVSFLALIFGTGTLVLHFYGMRQPVRPA